MSEYVPPNYQYLDPRDYRSEHLQNFLKKISMLESSGGQNVNHPEVKHGVQAGDTAIGEYGLMPKTLQELAKRYPSDTTKGLDKDHLELGAIVDRDFANTMAGSLADYLKNRRGLTDEQAAVAWEKGHNLPEDKIDLQSSRAKKFRVLSDAK